MFLQNQLKNWNPLALQDFQVFTFFKMFFWLQIALVLVFAAEIWLIPVYKPKNGTYCNVSVLFLIDDSV